MNSVPSAFSTYFSHFFFGANIRSLLIFATPKMNRNKYSFGTFEDAATLHPARELTFIAFYVIKISWKTLRAGCTSQCFSSPCLYVVFVQSVHSKDFRFNSSTKNLFHFELFASRRENCIEIHCLWIQLSLFSLLNPFFYLIFAVLRYCAC
jgi:hypothetical protein